MISHLTIAFGMPGGGEWLIIGAIVVLLFGAKKLPELARALGLAKKEFTKATKEASEEIEKMKETPPSDSSKSNNSTKKS